jgi:hypothetical protein
MYEKDEKNKDDREIFIFFCVKCHPKLFKLIEVERICTLRVP